MAETSSPSAAAGSRSPGPYPVAQVVPGTAASALTRATREAKAAVLKAAMAAAEIARRREDPKYAEAWKEEAPEVIVATAAGEIAAARVRLERGKNLGQVRDFQEAAKLATSAREELEALAGRLDDQLARLAVRGLLIERGRRDALGQAQEQAQEQAARENAAAKKAAAEKAASEKAPSEKVAAERAGAEKAAAEKAAAEKAATDRLAAEHESAEKLAREQERARREAESRSHAKARQPGPPSELRAAARALFRADYEEVARLLANVTFADRRATVTAALLLAAASYSLYLEGGEKDLRLRRQAGENARICRRLVPGLSPDPRLFSPRFVQFFRSAG
ncbi:MAG TPA: hypothetical protein VHG32_12985 [Thermoanaerobaculia bacterium]|nr:hypothetical protein [Thermoanaerobaculia bacterium]